MATAREWAEGYLAQGRADLHAAELVQGGEPSVTAMLLQMAFEKLAKAALLRTGQVTLARARGSHSASTRLVQQLAHDRRACGRLGWRTETIRTQVVPLVDALERAQPSLADGGPCLEYPWEDSGGAVRWPVRDLPIVRSFGPRQGSNGQIAMRFARDLADQFDALFT